MLSNAAFYSFSTICPSFVYLNIIILLFQDPISATVEDFWRMVVEHNICTMVQLTADDSDSFKYWSPTDMPGSEVDFGAMKVTLVRNIPVRCHHFRAVFNTTI